MITPIYIGTIDQDHLTKMSDMAMHRWGHSGIPTYWTKIINEAMNMGWYIYIYIYVDMVPSMLLQLVRLPTASLQESFAVVQKIMDILKYILIDSKMIMDWTGKWGILLYSGSLCSIIEVAPETCLVARSATSWSDQKNEIHTSAQVVGECNAVPDMHVYICYTDIWINIYTYIYI